MAPISVLPALPAAPGATSAPSDTATAALADSDDAPSFGDQFKAALASLGLGRAPRPAATLPAAASTPGADAATDPDGDSATDACDLDGCDQTLSDDLPEMLATLGFVLVPVVGGQWPEASGQSSAADGQPIDSTPGSLVSPAAQPSLDPRSVGSALGNLSSSAAELVSGAAPASVDAESALDADSGLARSAASAPAAGASGVSASAQPVASTSDPGDESGVELDLLSAAVAPETSLAAPPPPSAAPMGTDAPPARPRGGTPALEYDTRSVTGSVTPSVIAVSQLSPSVTGSVISVSQLAASVTRSVTGSVTAASDADAPSAARPQTGLETATQPPAPAGAVSPDRRPPDLSDGGAPTAGAPAAPFLAAAAPVPTAAAGPASSAAPRPAERVDAVNSRHTASPSLTQAVPLVSAGDAAAAEAWTSADSDAGDSQASGHDRTATSARVASPSVDGATAPEPPIAVQAPTSFTPPAAARPSAIVPQIAQQADLYRLPGGRGVRIQLRPEGLGGVEVTVRYGAAGALELHLNVEHAATGALVQAGWGELRDALALQGITPDRLVLSVSSRSDAGLSDTSQGGFRADGGQAGFAGQTGHERRDREERRPRSTWSPSSDLPVALDDKPLPSIAASSRIDYRV